MSLDLTIPILEPFTDASLGELPAVPVRRTIEQIISPRIFSCQPETSVVEAARLMREAACGSLLVIEDTRAVGIWTETDALRLNFADPATFELSVRDVMSWPVKTIPVDTTFNDAAVLFKRHGVRHYLVVDDQGGYRGILSQSDIVLNQGAEFFLKLKHLDTLLDPERRPLMTPADTPLHEAISLMREQHVEALLVCYPDSDYGILTQRDVVRLLAEKTSHLPVGAVASHPIISVPKQTSLYYARKLLAEKHIRHLGVLDRGELAGVISFSDILTSIEHEYVNELQYALKERDEALQISRQNLRMADKVFESTLEGIMITDANGVIETVNPAFSRITGYRKSEAVGRNARILSSGKQPPEFYRHLWTSLRENGFWQGELWNRCKNGTLFHEYLTITGIKDETGHYSHFAGIFTDITQRKIAEERLHFLANHDPLTGLPNRTLFMERLLLATQRAQREGRKIGLMFIDLDRFKYINDTMGHAAGDKLLTEIAERLKSTLRECDTVARLGGDEFTVILENISDVQHVAKIAKKLVSKLNGIVKIEQQEVFVTASIGIAIFPEDGEAPETLLMNADTAMYRAKERGKNNFQFFTSDMNTSTMERMRLENSLHAALSRSELLLHYQPKLKLDTGELFGYEALIRWNHPQMGMVSPAQFIPIAEDSSLIVPIGDWVLHTACAQARRWLDRGDLLGRMAVNISHRQLKLANLVDSVHSALQHSGLPAECLELEITESMAMDTTQETLDTLVRLREMGVHLTIDDFGTGYSSLSYLRKLPIDGLKIDRSFVAGVVQELGDAAITRAIISLAASLGLAVTAEGIEEASQLAFLREQGCPFGQGYFYCRPMDVARLDDWLAARRRELATH